jgi:GNAT superfamily N-acetyltransferase
MTLAVERFDARPWSEEQLEPLFGGGFPEFISADQVVKEYIGRVREWFADLSIILLDTGDAPVAAGWGVPIRWSGDVGDLPAGYTDTLIRAVEGRERADEPDTLVICGGVVARARTGQGISAELITALRELATPAGWPRVIAPVRPTLKPRYPLTPIEEFARWTQPDGAPLDPWLRTHWRLGARIIATAPRAQTMTGTVEEWQAWTGLALPSTGEYVIPDGLSILHVDREADLGTYTEPNVWMQHR